MDRRKFIAATCLGATVAGCLDSGDEAAAESGTDDEPISGEVVANEIEGSELSEISAEIEEKDGHDILVISGVLENTSDDAIGDGIGAKGQLTLRADFYDADGVKLDSDIERFLDGVAAKEKVQFRMRYGNSDAVDRYEIFAGVGTNAPTAGDEDTSQEETNDENEDDSSDDTATEDSERKIEITTLEATDIGEFDATLVGELTELEGYDTVECHFEWRTLGGDWNETAMQALDSTGAFNAIVTDLDDDTEYEFRVVATTDSVETADPELFRTDERLEISFHDGWENGNYHADPRWNVSGRGSAYAEIVEESAPDDGEYSLSAHVTDNLDITLEETFRWDTAWTVETLFKVETEEFDGRIPWEIDLCDGGLILVLGFHTQAMVGPYGPVKPQLDGDLLSNTGPEIDLEWRSDEWYHAKCHHDGEGVYSLKVWRDGTTEPSYQTVATGAAPDSDEYPIKFDTYAGYGAEMRVNTAFISYETK